MSDLPRPQKIVATGWIRSMEKGETGGSQPHLFQTEAGQYMVKVKNNPQGARVLANELVGGLCLDWLGVKHPQSAVVDIPQDVIDDNPGARFKGGLPLVSGEAFGSEYWQSDPKEAVDPKLICNREDVARTLAYDTWVRQHDGRQYRVRSSKSNVGKYEFIPVDQGHSLGNPNWSESGLEEKIESVAAPEPVISLNFDDFKEVIERLRSFSMSDAEHIVAQVPESWLRATERQALVRYLFERAKKAAEILEGKYPATGGSQ